VNNRRWAKPLFMALALFATPSHAERVVVLDLQGDARAKVRGQLERAIRSEGLLLVQLRKYKQEADRRRIRGARAGHPQAVASMSRALDLSGVVRGRVKKQSLVATLIDSSGREAFTRTVDLVRGALPGEAAASFASNVAGALRPKTVAAPTPPPKAEPPPETKPETAGQTLPELDLGPDTPRQDTAKKVEKKVQDAESGVAAEAGEVQRVERPQELRHQIGPRFVSARLTLSPTWRNYCARPGVSSCKDYDSMPAGARPLGDTVDFKSGSPYAGIGLEAELFPLIDVNRWLAGLGIEANYARGFSSTNVTQGTTTRSVSGTDNAFSALLAYRYYFPVAVLTGPQPGYGGLRFGYGVRDFSVDSTAGTPLLGSSRSYPLAGVEISVPIAWYLRVEAAGNLFFGPKAGQDQLADYGGTVSSSGLEFAFGVSGDVWGPVGYVAKFKYAKYSDTFSGRGTSWQNGGTAEETYAGLFAGASVSY